MKRFESVVAAIRDAEHSEARFGAIFRRTFDQLYDGQHTGRFAWDQLFKTEKTHFGTLLEINLRREFSELIGDGDLLDFLIHGHEIDCKYSQRMGAWMLPPECFGELLLVCTADDQASEWAVGVVRARPEYLREGVNRDRKSGLNLEGREAIHWVFRPGDLPPNALLQIAPPIRNRILAHRSGQARVNELFRAAQSMRIGRNTVATVAQQDDYMKRVRANGGARSALASEGIIICGGDYLAQRTVARELGLPVPEAGEFVSARVVRAVGDEPYFAELEGGLWRVADPHDPVISAPALPDSRRD